MDTRRLVSFIKVVDLGSLTKAANVLNVAQPALSQQIAALEAEFGEQLLIRSPRGVTTTEAGLVLYRQAYLILRQLDEAHRAIRRQGSGLAGTVKVGLAPFSTAGMFALPLLEQIRGSHPGILLHIHDYFGAVLSELLLKGTLDLALLYGYNAVRGLRYTVVLEEEWCLCGVAGALDTSDAPIAVADLAAIDLLLPTRTTFLRGMVERACAKAGFPPRVVAEIESMPVLTGALVAGLGATVLPRTIAEGLRRDTPLRIRPITSPALRAPLSLCQVDPPPDSPAITAVRDVLLARVRDFLMASRKPVPGLQA